MDPSRAAYEELEKAFASAQLSASTGKGLSQLNLTSSVHPADLEDSISDDANGSDILPCDLNTYPTLSREVNPPNIDFPPTPPSLGGENESESERSQTPRVSEANPVSSRLQSQASGPSSPSVNWHSLPTPESSPPSTRENLLFPLYQLSRNTSSYADSFRTARENQSAADSMSPSQVHSPASETFSFSALSKSFTVANMSLPRQDHEPSIPRSGGSGDDESRAKTDRIDSDSESRVRRHSATINAQTTLDSALTSSILGRTQSQGAAQRRLRTVIQPGDPLKRPDDTLLYINHSPTNVRKFSHNRAPELRETIQAKPTAVEERSPSPPTELVTTDLVSKSDQVADQVEDDEQLSKLGQIQDASETQGGDQIKDADQPKEPDLIKGVNQSKDVVQTLHIDQIKDIEQIQEPDLPKNTDRIGHVAQAIGQQTTNEPHTPPPVARSSLEDNNVVYKLIRDENVKRHSNLSDGSVQAMVVALPEQKRTLRHTPKRHSLRGDASLTSNSLRSSAGSGPKSTKRHTGTTFSASETDLTSAEVSPIVQKAALQSTTVSQSSPESRFGAISHTQERRSVRENLGGTRGSSGERHSLRAQSIHLDSVQRSISDADPSRTGALRANDPINVRRSGSPPLHQAAQLSSKPVYVPLMALHTAPRLRRFSSESRLENSQQSMRPSLGADSQRGSKPLEIKLEQAAKDFPREGQDLPDDRLSVGWASALASPKQGSFDMHSHHRTHTSFSFSQVSMRSDVELLEARGVTIFPHNNESLLVVQQTFPSKGRSTGTGEINSDTTTKAKTGHSTEPTAMAQPCTLALDEIGKPQHAVEVPLTNPRAPPEPPLIKFIPPTPSDELELDSSPTRTEEMENSVPQRWPSLSRRVRRYSESLIQPFGFARFGSLRRQHQAQQRKRASTLPKDRPTHLSSFWQPRDFWEEYDSDSDSDDDRIDADNLTGATYAALPPGGDTSHIGHLDNPGIPSTRAASFFPRQLSVRMPGFRGTGGFLLGNSLGIDRHGTNSRRPHVRPLLRDELLRPPPTRQLANDEFVRLVADHRRRRRRRTFTIPFSRGTRVEYVGLAYFRSQLQSLRAKREQAALERRRDDLRSRIGSHVYHDANYVGS